MVNFWRDPKKLTQIEPFYRLQQSTMFHQAHLFPIITLPPAAPGHPLPQIHHFASVSLLRKTLYDKPSFSKESTPIGSGKSIKQQLLPFERGFKRKYHSVCSRVVKIKQGWRQEQQDRRSDHILRQQPDNRPPPPPQTKFYERVGSGLLKGYSHAHRSKLKSKYNSRPSLKARQSLKLDAWSGKTSNADGKLHTLYEQQAKLERQLTVTVERKCSISQKAKMTEERRGLSLNLNETIDLRGWNHFEDIRQDDLLESA